MGDEMAHKRWQKLKHIFNKALELEGTERKAYINKACGEDRKLKEEVVSLLGAYDKPGVLDNPPDQLVTSVLTHHTSGDKSGQQIGPYEILETLGHGGMGSVYFAERADGYFDQKVALKLLRTGFTSENQTRRFLAERQILATLNHENISRLLDGGITEDGRPWFAMEYVEGLPIDKYCDTNQLTITQRLDLFLKVCKAVQYAHRKLIVHRDLKPSNILVTKDGTVKLLDFGIAKALNQDELLPESVPLTRTGLLPLTPAYASPEQIREDPITTASDMYQLGVVLYELLCGCRPYEVSGRTPSEIEHIICKEQPTRPSTAITKVLHEQKDTGKILRHVSRDRQTEPDQLQKRLRGDLDTIVLKTLRKEPDRRYDSAEQLAADIRHYLAGRPVAAHPDSMRYRATKFIRRHTIGVAAISVIVVLLFGYAATITWHSQRTQALLEQSQRETAKAEQITDFLMSMFEQVNPYESAGANTMHNDTLTTIQLLDSGAERIRRELSGQPEVQAKVMYKLGRIYRLLGRYDEAEPLLEEALMLFREHKNLSTEADLAQSLHELARLFRHKGDHERSVRLYNESLEIQRRLLGKKHPDIAENLNELGIIAAREGRLIQADSLFRRALDMQISLHGHNHPDVATGLHLLGLLHIVKEELPEAERMLRRSLSIRSNHVGSDHPMLVETQDRLGQVLVKQGRIEEAEPILREALATREKLFRNEHPSRAVSLTNMGRLLRKKEDYGKAEKYFQEAQAIYQKLYGPENLDAANTLFERAQVHRLKGDYKKAENLYKQAVQIHQSLIGLDNSYTQKYLNELAKLYETWGKPEEFSAYRMMLDEKNSNPRQ